MLPKISFRSEAQAELKAAALWYEEHQPGVGFRFMHAVGETVSSMLRTPTMYPRVAGEVRRALIKRFPYGIFYYYENNFIIVLAVYHAKRTPIKFKK